MKLFVYRDSQTRLKSLAVTLPQSLILTGDVGIGLLTISRDLAGSSLSQVVQPKNSADEIDCSNGTINAATIRQLYGDTRGKHVDRQIIVIDNSERMSRAAQAAFLKLLEEPPEATHFILTSHYPNQLLPTIRSRIQATHLRPISSEQNAALLAEQGIKDSKKITQFLYLAAGLPAELKRLLESDSYFDQQAALIADARLFLLATRYDQLVVVSKYFKDRGSALQFLSCSLCILRRSLSESPQPRLVKQLDQLSDVYTRLQQNANVRLQLTQFVL